MIDCNEGKTEKRHECANMGKVKRLELWWQLYRTSFPVRDLENFRPMDSCWTECTTITSFMACDHYIRLSRWPRCLRRRSAAARLLGLRVRIPARAWISVSYECNVFSEGRYPVQKSPIECGVSECDFETSTVRLSRL